MGPWPFVTKRVFHHPDGSQEEWQSRYHRKKLPLPIPLPLLKKALTSGAFLFRCLWMPRSLNWWIGTVFALGAALFVIGSVLCLDPSLAKIWSLDENAINRIFFAGSIPFTIAAYLQLYQAANAGEPSPAGSTTQQKETSRFSLFGWQPANAGWLSCALQFIGTLLFNVNTFDAMIPALGWLQQDFFIWIPNFIGSIFFLASSYIAFIEYVHSYWKWAPSSLTWWIVGVNLLGSVAFIISAIFAFVPAHEPGFDAIMISVIFTLIGAFAFFVGSLLMLPETVE